MRHEDARADLDEAADAVGLVREGGAHRELGVADADRVAGLEAEPVHESGRHHGAELPRALGERVGEVSGGREADRAVERICLVDRLDLDEAAARAISRARHAAKLRHVRDLARRIEICAFLGARRAVDERELDVAAQQRARVGGEARLHRGPERAHAGDDGDAQSEAQDEDAEAAHAAPQLAHGEAKGEADHAHGNATASAPISDSGVF